MNWIKMTGKRLSLTILILNVLTNFFAFLQTVFIVRILDLSSYGAVATAMTLIAFLQNIVGMRTGEIVLKYCDLKKNKDEIYPIVIKALGIDLCVSLLLFFSTLLLGYFFGYIFSIDYKMLCVLSLTILLSVGFLIFESLFIVFNQVFVQFQIKMAVALFSLLITIFMSYKFSLYGYVGSILITTFLRTLLYGVAAYKNMKTFQIPFDKRSDKIIFDGFFNFSVCSYLSTTFKSGIASLDVLLLSIHIPASEIAAYKIAKNLAAIPAIFLGSLWVPLNPQILSNAKNNRFQEILKMVNKVIFFALFCFLLIIGPLFFLSPHFFSYLYGISDLSVSYIFLFLFSGTWFSYTFGAYGRLYYLGQNRLERLTLLTFISFSFIIIFGVFFTRSAMMMSFVVMLNVLFISLSVYVEVLYKCFFK